MAAVLEADWAMEAVAVRVVLRAVRVAEDECVCHSQCSRDQMNMCSCLTLVPRRHTSDLLPCH